MIDKNTIIDYFSDFMYNCEGICGFISSLSSQYVFDVLGEIDINHLSKVQFDQLLALQNLHTMSYDFYEFYWLSQPKEHFYQVDSFVLNPTKNEIVSLEQLKWGFTRLFIDCLYVFGNIQRGYDKLCNMDKIEINMVFADYVFNTQRIISRGNTLHFVDIDRNDRYLISEMACKTYADIGNHGKLTEKLKEGYKKAKEKGVSKPTFRMLLEGEYYEEGNYEQMSLFPKYVFDECLDCVIDSEEEITKKASNLSDRFIKAHEKALKNTELYLSLVRDLDVYVATSMRSKKDFMNMASFCYNVFKNPILAKYDLRYFDPTISAAESHEDKGLIECLMVKSAQILIYHTGESQSFGKDVEAAMALCLGKPTIFYCAKEEKMANFFRNIHPLSRLVNFKTGVAGGVIVCKYENEVAEIVSRIITNRIQYRISRKKDDPNCGYYLLKESMTESVVRVQTDDKLLTSAFWNNYLND